MQTFGMNDTECITLSGHLHVSTTALTACCFLSNWQCGFFLELPGFTEQGEQVFMKFNPNSLQV